MKKALLLTFIVAIMARGTLKAQAYRSFNIVEPTYKTVYTTNGIEVKTVTYNQGDSYTVGLKNSNYCNSGEVTSNEFEWYLSYKGKRISDYYKETLRCNNSTTRKVYCWPGEVPVGNEKYVSVQLGKQKDSRDDD